MSTNIYCNHNSVRRKDSAGLAGGMKRKVPLLGRMVFEASQRPLGHTIAKRHRFLRNTEYVGFVLNWYGIHHQLERVQHIAVCLWGILISLIYSRLEPVSLSLIHFRLVIPASLLPKESGAWIGEQVRRQFPSWLWSIPSTSGIGNTRQG